MVRAQRVVCCFMFFVFFGLMTGCPGKQRIEAGGGFAGGGTGSPAGVVSSQESIVDRSLRFLQTPAERGAAEELTNTPIYFEFDKFDITQESLNLLSRKAELLKQYPHIKVSIQGHCDERGTEEYNLALGERRARVAFEFLVRSGISPSQLEMISYGKLRPAVHGSGEQVWSMNRRDEFIVLNPR